jgi:hypothetical protein
MFFKGGELAETIVGAKKYEQYDEALSNHLA